MWGNVAGKDFLGMPLLCPAHKAVVHPGRHPEGSKEERGSYRALTEREQLFSVFMGISVCV